MQINIIFNAFRFYLRRFFAIFYLFSLLFPCTRACEDETDTLTARVTVTNTGSVAANHTLLLFLFDMYRTVTPEYKLLKR